jgi:hypothetical protein
MKNNYFVNNWNYIDKIVQLLINCDDYKSIYCWNCLNEWLWKDIFSCFDNKHNLSFYRLNVHCFNAFINSSNKI